MKISLYFKAVFPAACGIMTLCGCSLFFPPDQTAIEYYDLVRPEKTDAVPVYVEQFVNFSGERQRMIRRKNKTSVLCSNFHKWIQSPGGMLTRYLRLAFRNDEKENIWKNSNPVILRGEVLVFEFNDGCAELGIRYHLTRGRQSFSKTVLIREKMESKDPESFSRAMSRAAARFAKMIAGEARQFPAERK